MGVRRAARPAQGVANGYATTERREARCGSHVGDHARAAILKPDLAEVPKLIMIPGFIEMLAASSMIQPSESSLAETKGRS